MSLEPRVLARNTTYFTFALIAQKVISFLYFTYLARIFFPEDIGKYIFALSFITIFSVLIDVGLGYVLTTEVAKDKTKAQSYWQNVVGFKIIALLVVVGLVFLVINLLNYPLLTKQLVYIACAVMVIDSLVLSAYSLIRSWQNLWWESLGTILFQIVVAFSGLCIAQLTRDLRWFILALIIGGLVNLIYSWYKLKVKFGINLWPRFDSKIIKYLLILAWPFGLALILTRIYGYLDTVLLSLLAGDRDVGFYGVAYKITFAFQFIPAAFAASLLAGFSAYFVNSRQLLSQTFERSIHYLNIIAIPLGFGMVVLAPKLVRIIYPGYEAAIVPLQILMISLIFLFLTFPIGSLLSAGGRQRRNTANLGITVIISVILNILLIPQWQAVGAATASLVSTMVYLFLGAIVVPELVSISAKKIFINVAKVLISALIMATVLYSLINAVNALILVFLGMIIYGVCLFVLKGINYHEIKDFFVLVFNKSKVKYE
ncbi:MAG: flippase [Patescibacteria group bacterium]